MVATFALVVAAGGAFAQARDNFMQQQAYAEMQRVGGQVDVLQNNLDTLQRRVAAIESGSGETKGIRQEIDSLKLSVAELRREMQNMRAEIVKDLAARIAKMQPTTPQPAARTKPTAERRPAGPCKEYVVQKGDNLSLVAEAFGTTVSKIREMNGLKGDNLRIGQKLLVPAPKN